MWHRVTWRKVGIDPRQFSHVGCALPDEPLKSLNSGILPALITHVYKKKDWFISHHVSCLNWNILVLKDLKLSYWNCGCSSSGTCISICFHYGLLLCVVPSGLWGCDGSENTVTSCYISGFCPWLTVQRNQRVSLCKLVVSLPLLSVQHIAEFVVSHSHSLVVLWSSFMSKCWCLILAPISTAR